MSLQYGAHIERTFLYGYCAKYANLDILKLMLSEARVKIFQILLFKYLKLSFLGQFWGVGQGLGGMSPVASLGLPLFYHKMLSSSKFLGCILEKMFTASWGFTLCL